MDRTRRYKQNGSIFAILRSAAIFAAVSLATSAATSNKIRYTVQTTTNGHKSTTIRYSIDPTKTPTSRSGGHHNIRNIPDPAPREQQAWFKPYFTRQEVEDAGGEPVFDIHCRHHQILGHFCSTAIKLGESTNKDDVFGSFNIPSASRNDAWFKDRGIKVLKVLPSPDEDDDGYNGGQILNEFEVNYQFMDETLNDTQKNATSLAMFDNRFDYISVYPNQLREYMDILNLALLNSSQYSEVNNSSADTSINPFFIDKVDYYDWNTSQYYEMETLKRNSSCEDIGELLMQESLITILFENHSFQLGAKELFTDFNGTCNFAISAFVDEGLGDSGMSIIGQPFLKKYDVAFQVLPDGIVLVQRKDYKYEPDQAEEEPNKDHAAHIQKKTNHHKETKPAERQGVHYSDLALKFMKDHGLPVSWFAEEMREFEAQSNTIAIVSCLAWILMVFIGFDFVAVMVYFIYEMSEWYKNHQKILREQSMIHSSKN